MDESSLRRARSRRRGPDMPRAGVDLARAWPRARRAIETASGQRVREIREIAEPVPRARRLAELAAPALLRLRLALELGTSPEELSEDRSGCALMLEGSHRDLARVGLGSADFGDTGGLSERMTRFLAVWFERPAPAGLPAPASVPLDGIETGPPETAGVPKLGWPPQ